MKKQETEMEIVNELCPKCQTLRMMTVSISRREEVDSEGNKQEIVTKSFHCESCHSFVRSEDVEVEEEVEAKP
jgi:hypothetical protein